MQRFTFNQRVENLFKSYFSTYENIRISISNEQIKIDLVDEQNLERDSAKILKRFMKKLLKILNR